MDPAPILHPFGMDCVKSLAHWILIRKIREVLGTLNSTGNKAEAYNLILAVYDLIAVETPLDIIYPDAIKQFITEFLLDIDDLLIDYESEE